MKKKKDQEPAFRFLAILNRRGIVCGSNLPGAIFHIYDNPAVAIINDPNSKIGWNKIIKDFKPTLLANSPSTLRDIVDRFRDFLNIPENLQKTGKLKRQNILFLGLNPNELYPSLIRCEMIKDSEGIIEFLPVYEMQINGNTKAFITTLGNFNHVWPMIEGISENFESELIMRFKDRLNKFETNLLLEELKPGSESTLEEFLNKLTTKTGGRFAEEELLEYIDKSRATCHSATIKGLDNLNVKQMGNAVEYLINAESCFAFLKCNEIGCGGKVCEEALLTHSEGFAWIRHN